jgi:CRP-like cAMP-binding protein
LIVAAGDLQTCRQGRRGKLEPGDAFGWTAMHQQGRYDATVLALSSSRLLVMGHDQFRAVRAATARNPLARNFD